MGRRSPGRPVDPRAFGQFAASVLAVLLLGCSACAAPNGPARPAHPSAPPASRVEADTALFAAVLRSIKPTGDGPLHVDPRPLVADGRVLHVDAANLAPVPPELLRGRAAALDRMGIPRTDAVADIECSIGNMRVQVESDPAATPGCEGRARILSVIASLPFGADPATGERDSVTVRVFEINVDPRFGSHSAKDYLLVLDSSTGAWRLVRKTLVFAGG